MKRPILFTALAAMVLTSVWAKKTDDPVMMTVNGKDVKLSEFQYLYNKNNSQQSQQQPIDEYVDMFINYKLKVADAEAARIDTTEAFKTEYASYRRQLSNPYLRDTVVFNNLLQEAYARLTEEVDVMHLMLPRGHNQEEANEMHHKLDSLRTLLINGADWAEIAMANSADPGVKRNMGHMGWMTATQYPYAFELVAYNTPVGEISEIIDTDFGHHIVKVLDRRPARGQVLVQHILKLFPRGNNVDNSPEQKAAIDSIYNALLNGADFDELAKVESEDPGSARNGGRLPAFGAGRMVPEFEEMSFSLADGELSKPFATSYGWHVVKRIEGKGVGTFEDNKESLAKAINNDERGTMPVKACLDRLKKQYKASVNNKGLEKVMDMVAANGGQLDSALVDRLSADNTVVFTVNKQNHTIAECIDRVKVTVPIKMESARMYITDAVNRTMDDATFDVERDNLAMQYPEYRNLVNEYRDGMLLFEVSNRNVWEKASKDKEGLEKFFQANRNKYTWEKPKYKGMMVFTPNDSVENAVKAYIAETTIEPSKLSDELKAKFGRDVKVEKVIAAHGDNAIVDAAAFGDPKPEPTGRWTNYFAWGGNILEAPEEASDVRGLVTTDYQAQLEQEWVASLRERYPYKVNTKVLDTLR